VWWWWDFDGQEQRTPEMNECGAGAGWRRRRRHASQFLLAIATGSYSKYRNRASNAASFPCQPSRTDVARVIEMYFPLRYSSSVVYISEITQNLLQLAMADYSGKKIWNERYTVFPEHRSKLMDIMKIFRKPE